MNIKDFIDKHFSYIRVDSFLMVRIEFGQHKYHYTVHKCYPEEMYSGSIWNRIKVFYYNRFYTRVYLLFRDELNRKTESKLLEDTSQWYLKFDKKWSYVNCRRKNNNNKEK